MLPKQDSHKTSSELAENAAKELESLSEYMPNISDIEARTLALRLYYMEVVEGKSPTNAQNMVSKMFLVSPSTVRRWITAWETTGEEALLDHGSTPKDEDPSLFFASPDSVFELHVKSWINERLKQGGNHADGYLTIHHIQSYINEVLLHDLAIEVLDMHEARYPSLEV